MFASMARISAWSRARLSGDCGDGGISGICLAAVNGALPSGAEVRVETQYPLSDTASSRAPAQLISR